jgi:acyl-coenzyme A thioesterase PaaI-like protein/quinol monooxygenase YgiN
VTTQSNLASEDLIPEGFQRHTRHSGLTDPWEPIYARRSSGGVSLAIRASAAHANSRGFVHGGLITALADNAMGLSCGQEVDDTSSLVTVSLSMDFVGFAKVGQWLEIRPEVIKTGKSLCFASALVLAGDSVCARASGVFKLAAGQAPTLDSRSAFAAPQSGQVNEETPMAKLAIVATIKIPPGRRDEYLKHLRAHAERCRVNEPGTLQFDIVAPHDDPNAAMLYEVYASSEAFQDHWRGESMKQLRRDSEGIEVSLSGVRGDLVE